MSTPRFSIGVDLGTTNCALSFVPLVDEAPRPIAFQVSQVVHAGEVAARPLLPSFLYLPASSEFAPGALSIPWAPLINHTVGRFARDYGANTPIRLVSSAKSWLSHAGVDRRAPILPWGAPNDVPKLSPLDASTRFLAHLKAAWDTAHPDHPLADQDLVLTVPASFDAIARELTAEAAERIGLGEHIRLLEEPQAALYAWLADQGKAWRDTLTVGDTILVCDIGGGTTDFSLIAVRETSGRLELERVAVGEHILLGGDNMDLALAYTVKARLAGQGTSLDEWQVRALTHGCRQAKETLFNVPSRAEHPLVIPGRGSRLIGGTIRTALSRTELESVVLQGFFPHVRSTERPKSPRRAGLARLGLPYASDAGITRHLAAFLGRSGLDRKSGQSFVHPTAVLFNGGVTRSSKVRDQILGVLNGWVDAEGGTAPRVLEGAHPDQAVSRGAAYYGHARRAGGLRIKGGTARTYYIGVERAGLAIPGIPPQLDALCIAPFGMEEGAELTLETPFGLFVGEPVSFRFFCASNRPNDELGVVVDPSALEELAPIETTLDGDEGRTVTVRLHARVTEVGTLDLSAVEDDAERRWKLSFNVRVH